MTDSSALSLGTVTDWRPSHLSWQYTALETLEQEPIHTALGDSIILFAWALDDCHGVSLAETVTELLNEFPVGISAGVKATLKARPLLGGRPDRQHVAILSLILAMRRGVGQHALTIDDAKQFGRAIDVALWKEFAKQNKKMAALKWSMDKTAKQNILDDLLRCFVLAEVGPTVLQKEDFSRLALAIEGSLMDDWVDWADDVFFGDPNLTCSTAVVEETVLDLEL